MRAITLLVGTIGCGFHSPSANSVVDGVPDASLIDTSVDAGPCVSWPALNIDPCNVALGDPGPVIAITGGYVLNTDDGTLMGPAGTVSLPGALIAQTSGGPMVRAINASGLAINANATVAVVGTHPIIFVVHGDATIDGVVDASAHVEGNGARTAGSGGNDASQCTNATGDDGKDASGVGGGGGAGGGAYGGNGGDGGDGQGDKHGGKGTKGMKIGDAMIEPLRGGCRGGIGGNSLDVVIDHGGLPGDGGGAIEITALRQITINGTIAAGGSGGGASGAVANAGGGGGGSGGAILIDGETSLVTTNGKLCANGGGGGEGGQVGAMSSPGAAATCTTTVAAGGATQVDGGDGGDGGAGTPGDGSNGVNGGSGAAGGGGGGGVGRIRVHGRTQSTIDASALVSPPASS